MVEGTESQSPPLFNDSIQFMNPIINSLIAGSNYPSRGKYEFESSGHIRYQNGSDISGYNTNCHRNICFENNIDGGEGYTVTIYNLDGIHPIWGNNVQMSPKRMKIVSHDGINIRLRGYGVDPLGALFSNYGITVKFDNGLVNEVILHLLDRNTHIRYLK